MKEKILKIIQLAKTTTAKNTYLVFIGNSIAGFLGMLGMIVVSRHLGPTHFGSFSVAFALFTLLLKLGDLGLNFGLVKEISRCRIKGESHKINNIFISVFWIKIIFIAILMIIGIFSSKYLSIKLFNSPLAITSNNLVILFFGLDVFYDLVRVYLEANKRFLEGSAIYGLANFIKLIMLLVILIAFPHFKELIAAYIFAPFIAALLLFSRTKIRIKLVIYWGELKNLLKFSSWMALSVVLATVGENLNVFMVSAKLSSYETGIYSAADKFIMPFSILAGALGTVLISRTSEFLEMSHIKSFIKKVFILQFVLLVLFIFLYPCTYLLPFILGSDYQPAVIILQILIIANFFRLAITPLNSVFYPLNKSVIFALDAVVQVMLLFSLNQYFIKNFQAKGAAFSLLIANIIIFILNYLFLYFVLKKHGKKSANLGRD